MDLKNHSLYKKATVLIFVASLHDVSPHTWGASERILAALPGVPVSLLITTDQHGRGHFLHHPAFCA